MSHNFVTNPELIPILEELKELEPLIYAANAGASRMHFERLLTQDFWEVGASGKIYDRDVVLGVLEERQKNPSNEIWQTSDFNLRKMESSHYLLTYTLQQPTRLSRRSTIWHKSEDGWKMLYHQGTVVI